MNPRNAIVVDTIEQIAASYTAACAVKDANSQTDKLALFFSTETSNQEEFKNLLKKIRQKVINSFGVNPDYFIPLNKEQIPKTSIGKIQRSQLTKRFDQGEFQDIIKDIDILLENDQTLPDWFYRQVWQVKEPLYLDADLLSGYTLIFIDQLGLGELVAQKLQEKSLPYIIILAGNSYSQINGDRYTINPTETEDYQRLIASLTQQNKPINNIIHLWTYKPYQGEISCSKQLEKAQEEGIYSLLFIVQALTKIKNIEQRDQSIQLLFISSCSQSLNKDDEIAYEKSPVLGLTKTISQEFSWINSRHIDLPVKNNKVNSNLILQELSTLSKDREIAYREQKRLVKGLEKVDLSQETKQEIPFKKGGIYLITGGLGGIGIEIAKYLLENYQARLLVIGITDLPEKKEWNNHLEKEDDYTTKIKNLQRLERLEGEVIYQAVDVGDLTQLEKAVKQVKTKWKGELDGIVHLAGIYQEYLLIEQTKQSLSNILRPKVLGTWNLHQLIKKNKGIFISFSSLASFFGGATLSGYAAANRFLEHFNHYQQSKNLCPSYCYSWTAWQETGMSKGKYTVRSQGYYSVTVQQGLNSFLASLYHKQTQLMIGLDGANPKIKRHTSCLEGLQKLTAYYTLKQPSKTLDVASKLSLKDYFGTPYKCQFYPEESLPLTHQGQVNKEQLLLELRDNNQEWIAPRNEIESKIAKIWQDVLNIQKIGINDNFFELGGHSLLASQVISRLRDLFAVELSLQSLLEYPTIISLTQMIEVLNVLHNSQDIITETQEDYEEGEL
ncbi:SDR family NAD(P)-dependent oxidoreductase [Crocosphaera sp. XPORK-15E]|uniref:SDR family NAD(P)-dependent oxidoreductase n=1 Tax=Crocosphaera sp. XPORK-15E TaxID=3110247 RepID=UPI002B213314|nr:SDR family NAD(P)-dependent oxidoreductase [Crocosphaera sp. XPORK-15E]MEA5536737.1 SDR family NAD(P)-dependent oxidoreductase [Crocosphaera sp. XPORK-15E]